MSILTLSISLICLILLTVMAIVSILCYDTVYSCLNPGAGIGEACVLHTDCADWGPATTAIACCKSVCTQKQADWAGVGYCPNECVGYVGGAAGTCTS